MRTSRLLLTAILAAALTASASASVNANGNGNASESIATHAEYAADVKQHYTEEWQLSEKQLGLTLQYTYSFSRTSMGVFSVPVVNKAGNTYLVAHKTSDLTANSILCLDKSGKVKWRKDFKANELNVRSDSVYTDQEGNLYYITTEQSGKSRSYKANSLAPDGTVRWTYNIPGSNAAQLALVGNGNTIVATTNKLYVLNAKGQVVSTKNLPQTSTNILTFVTAGQGKIVYSRTLFNKDTYVGNEFEVYNSEHQLLYKVPATMMFGDRKSKIIRFFDNGDFLHVQGYNSMNKQPAVLKMYDAKGKLKWKKVIYSDFGVDNVFIAGRSILYYPGIFSQAAVKSLQQIDADTGEEIGKHIITASGEPTVYAGYNQEMVMGHDSLIINGIAGNNDLTQPKDLAIYEFGRNVFKRIDSKTLAVTANYSETLDVFMEENYNAVEYQVVSARNGFAYVYFREKEAKQFCLVKIKLPAL